MYIQKTWLSLRDLYNQLLFSSSNIFSIQLCHSKKWRSDPQPEIEDSSKPSSKSPLPFDNLLNLSSAVLEANTVRLYARCDFDRLMHGVNPVIHHQILLPLVAFLKHSICQDCSKYSGSPKNVFGGVVLRIC